MYHLLADQYGETEESSHCRADCREEEEGMREGCQVTGQHDRGTEREEKAG